MSTLPLILIGCGGHAMSVASALSPRRVVGYVDLSQSEAMPWTYLGNDDEYLKAPISGCHIITMVAGKDCNLAARRRLIERYDDLIHEYFAASSAEVDDSAQIGAGTVIMRHAVVNCRTSIGRHCVINTGAVIEHDCKIGNNVFIGPGAVVCGGVTIGDDVYLGANATIRPGCTIISGVTIGLGAAVVNEIDTPGVYTGVPAKRRSDA